MCIQRPGFSLNSWHRHSSKPAWISVIFLVLQSDGTNLIHAAYSLVSGLHSLGYKPHVSSLPYSSAVWSLGALLCLGDVEQQLWHSLAIHPELPGKKKTMSVVWTSVLVALCWCWRARCRNNPVTPFSSEANMEGLHKSTSYTGRFLLQEPAQAWQLLLTLHRPSLRR